MPIRTTVASDLLHLRIAKTAWVGLLSLSSLTAISCAAAPALYGQQADAAATEWLQPAEGIDIEARVNQYVPFRLEADVSGLTAKQKQMIPLLIEAGKLMDQCFWIEAYGDRDSLLSQVTGDLKAYAVMNYGPWDRLDNNSPFIAGFGAKPAGANFYPTDMTKEEFEALKASGKDSLYTFVRRNEAGELVVIPYKTMLAEYVQPAAKLLEKAAALSESAGLRRYLLARSAALLNDDYQPSDFAWLEMKDNTLDVVIGPIETYEDALFGYKAAHECYVLIKDLEWSDRLSKYAKFLPSLQAGLPVPEKYKQEQPGSDTDLNAYDVVYYAGDCNSGSKTIAINLPNDEEVQLKRGTRRLQLKNAMRAKFDKIMLPIAEELIAEDQRSRITFDAFFANTMFHEVAHGLGIKNTLDGQGTVREALKANSSTIEEGKADILGLYMIQQLHQRGEITGELSDYYTTFMAGIFRSVRFGAASAHGRANMIRFNFFSQAGAFERSDDGKYRVNEAKFTEATEQLARRLLTIQGDGDFAGASRMLAELGVIRETLQSDLDRLDAKGIPVDVTFEQGVEVLGL